MAKPEKESSEQIKLATWLTKQNIRFSASANGGKRNLMEALKFKRMGVSPGFPDIFIPFPCGSHHGLLIELKRQSGGIISPHQKDWLSYLRSVGYCAEVAYGFDQAKQIVESYLANGPKPAMGESYAKRSDSSKVKAIFDKA